MVGAAPRRSARLVAPAWRALGWLLVVAGTLLAPTACSNLPVAALPAHRDHHVEAEFVVPADGQLALPASSQHLRVLELQLDPSPLAERFRAGRRWFDYPPGARVIVRGRFRTWADGGEPPAPAEVVLRGAERVTPIPPLPPVAP